MGVGQGRPRRRKEGEREWGCVGEGGKGWCMVSVFARFGDTGRLGETS